MSSELRLRRGNQISHDGFVGAVGEVTYNTDTKGLHTHDGTTPGGLAIGSYTAPFTGAAGRSQQDKNSDTLNVFDFFTPAELTAYKATPTTFNSSRPLQAFFDVIAATDVHLAQCAGSFAIATGLNLGGVGGCRTKNITGNLTLSALSTIDTLLTINPSANLVWTGFINCIGVGSNSYATRTCRIGVALAGNADRIRLSGVRGQYLQQTLVSCKTKTTLTNLGDIKASDVGSGYSVGTSLSSTWDTKVDAGESGSLVQTSTITVATLPPTAVDTTLCVVISGSVHYVKSVDYGASKLEIFPWVDNTLSSGSLVYLFGGAVNISGGDASVVGIDSIDAIRCSAALQIGALYAPVVDRCVAQSCFTNTVLGLRNDVSFVGGQINGMYCENTVFDIVKLTRAVSGLNIASNYALSLSKVAFVNPRATDNSKSSLYGNMQGITLSHNGSLLQYQKAPYDGFERSATIVFDLFDGIGGTRTYKRNTANITLSAITAESLGKNAAFGIDSAQIVIIGSGVYGNPTSTCTFTAPVGATVNGGATASFNGFTGPALFNVFYDIPNTNFIVSSVAEIAQASVTYDPPSLAANEIQSTTVTVVGAALGHNVNCSFSRALGVSTRMWAEVTATNTVTVYHQNLTGAAVDVLSGTLKVKVI